MTLHRKPKPNLESIQVTFIKDGFAIKDFRPFILISTLKEEKKTTLVFFQRAPGSSRNLLTKISIHS